MKEITDPRALAVDSEVTVTITGRVVASSGAGLVVEYLRDNGFPDRVAVHTAPGVTIQPAGEIGAEEVAVRQDAHWRVAMSAADYETRARALLSMPYRDRLPGDRAAVVEAAEVTVRAESK
jgi:hypothetical protein